MTRGPSACAPPDALQATAAVDAEGVPLFAAALLEPTEIIIGVWRPSVWYIPLRSARVSVGVALAAVMMAAGADAARLEWATPIAQVAALLIVARVTWVMADWATRIYILTDRRVMRRRGLVNPTVHHAELSKLRRIDLLQSAPARMVGTGSIVFSARAEGSYDAAWVLVPRAAEVRQLVVDTKARYRQ